MKKISGQLGFCIGIALLFTIAACKKDNGDPINSDLVKYFDYKAGTYWMMQDSISGRVDSFFVTSSTFYPYVKGNNDNHIYIAISEYTDGHENADSVYWSIDLSSGLINLYGNLPFYNGPLEIGYPFSIAPPEEYIYPSLAVNANTYSNVAEIIYDVHPHFFYRFYLNNDNGFIKICINVTGTKINYVWELQRENIVH